MQPSPPAGTGIPAKAPPAQVAADLQNIIDTGARSSGVPGVQVEIVTPQWTWDSAAGTASPITGEKATPGMQFLIASVSKVFASVAVQKLAEEGKLSLDDPVGRWLPADLVAEIPNGHIITVRQLLDHTSGIADYDEAAIILMELENPTVPVPYTVGIGQGLNASPLYAPGANYTYSNVNYNLLTLVVDKAAGMPYEEYVNKTILVPLGMKDTYLSHVNYFTKPHMSATVTLPDGTIVDYTNLYVEFDRGAGEIVSTAADLNRFHKALRDGKILSPASLKAMELPTPQSHRVNGDVISGYGLGYAIQKNTALDLNQRGHGGGYPGSATFWFYSPELDTYIAMNVNTAVNAAGASRDIYLPLLRYLKDTTGSAAVTASAAPAVAMSSPFPPVPVASSGGMNLAYEIELKPAGNAVISPTKVEVLDPATGSVLYAAEGDLLAQLYHPASVPPPTAAELQNGTAKLVYPRVSLWFTVSPDAVPDKLTHRLILNATTAGGQPVVITGGEVAVRKDLAPVVIGKPMSGEGWLAMETTSPLTHHFSAQITLNGVARVPQRYAQDWILVDPVTGQAAAGDANLATNYLGFGKEILAVADGTVVDMLDGLPDVPTIFSAPPATFETAAGNFVIEDIGNGKYACYAHMVNGSVRVKKGDTLKEGQVIGLMGNSGNSDIPHLHFQVVTDTPSFLGAEGYPHVYRSFDAIGTVNMTRATEMQSQPDFTFVTMFTDFGDLITFLPKPVHRENMLPENNDVVKFP